MNRAILVIIAGSIFLVDQLFKYLTKEIPEFGISFVDSNFFSAGFFKSLNQNFAWGIPAGPRFFLPFILFFCLLAIAFLIFYKYQKKQKISLILAIIFGAAISNVFDRLYHGGVVDYIALRFGSFDFPIFNISDILIVGGLFYLLIFQRKSL